MGAFEPAASELRSTVLHFIMLERHIFTQTWSGTLAFGGGGLSRSTARPHTFLSLYMSLFKSLRLELAEEPCSTGNSEHAVFPVPTLLEEILRMTLMSRAACSVSSVAAPPTQGASEVCSSKDSSSTQDAESCLMGWLRLQLILMRSWVLLWTEVSHRDTASVGTDVTTRVLTHFISEFQRKLAAADFESSVLDSVHKACGFNLVVEERLAADVPKGHARWERFAFNRLAGRVMPGCSHWGCTNLGGFSEDALLTRLCSGCKRARYCSPACQRAAWVEGGHREACGSQTHTPPS